MKTLYVSDLDGTLLRRDATLSGYTCSVINSLTRQGVLFSYATARSIVTAKLVTKGLDAHIPLVTYNGCFVLDNVTREAIMSNFFDDGAQGIFNEMMQSGTCPIVYSYIDGRERFSFFPEKCSKGMMDFVRSRETIAVDKRPRRVSDERSLMDGRQFYFTCIDAPEKLEPLYEKYREKYNCVFQRDIYSGEYWLEIMPKKATKAGAVRELARLLGCDRIVAFGDAKNDIPMFETADECYAVANAAPELKSLATAVIGSNEDDGVAKWLAENCRPV